MRIEKIRKFYRPITVSENGLLLYKNNKLFILKQDEISFFCKIKLAGYRGAFSKTRLLTRIFHRYVFCGITPKNSGFSFICFNDGVYKVDYNTKSVSLSFSFECEGMHRPLAFFDIKDVPSFEDCIVFGDYSYNKNRNEISIYKYSFDKWEKALTFPPGTVRHIHSIIPDKYKDRVLILTGDYGDECAIWSATNDFKKLKCILKGEQKHRFCCARAYESGVILVTDSPFDENKVYRLTEDGGVFLTELYSIKGPTVFFTYHGDNIVFATDVENDEKNLNPFQEFLINKKGDGVLDNFSHVYIFKKDGSLKELVSFEKDRLPMRIFGFGTVHFPEGENGNVLYMYPMAVKRYDQWLVRIDLSGT